MLRNVVRSRLVAATLGAVVMAAAGGIAWAAIPDSANVVHGCYKTTDATRAGGAALSVIDPENGGTCRAGQSALSLDVTAGVVRGLVAADGSVSDAQGGLSATVLDSGLYLLTYTGFDPAHPGIVTGMPETASPHPASRPLR
jgi:hypothetical protein